MIEQSTLDNINQVEFCCIYCRLYFRTYGYAVRWFIIDHILYCPYSYGFTLDF